MRIISNKQNSGELTKLQLKIICSVVFKYSGLQGIQKYIKVINYLLRCWMQRKSISANLINGNKYFAVLLKKDFY